jgi:hypothetical protein
MSETNFLLSARPVVDVSLEAGGPALTPAVGLAASYDLSLGLTPEGAVVSLGDDAYGQQGLAGITGAVSVAAGGRHVLALLASGAVLAAGDAGESGFGVCDVGLWEDVIGIGAMWLVSYALRKDGRCLAVGDNARGQCEVGHWREVAALASGVGDYHFAAVTGDGRCLATGDNSYGECEVSDWRGIKAVAVGSCWTLGLRADGVCLAVGDNYYGQCAVSEWTEVVAITATGTASVGLRADGTLLTAGLDLYGGLDVGAWTGVTSVAAGYWHLLGLKADGSVLATGRNRRGECAVSGWRLATSLPPVQSVRAKRAGVAYVEASAQGLRGPYTTGCASGRQCYELSLRRRKVDLELTVKLDSPYTLCAYEKDADAVTLDAGETGAGRLARWGAATLAPGRGGAGIRLPGPPDEYALLSPRAAAPCVYTEDLAWLREPCSFELAFDYLPGVDYTQGGSVAPTRVYAPLRLAVGTFAGESSPLAPIGEAAFEWRIDCAYEQWTENGASFQGWRWRLKLLLNGALYGRTGIKTLSLSTNLIAQVDGQWRRHALVYERRPASADQVHYYLDENWISTTELDAEYGVWTEAITEGGARLLAANLMPGTLYTLDNLTIAKQ